MSISSDNRQRKEREKIFSRQIGVIKNKIDKGEYKKIKDIDFSIFGEFVEPYKDFINDYINLKNKKGFEL